MKYFKALFLLLFLSVSSDAYTLYRGQCVDYYYFTNSSFVYFEKYSESQPSAFRSEPLSSFDLTQFDIDHDYSVSATICYPTDLYYGMSSNQYHFMMALSGLITGTLFAIFAFYIPLTSREF